MLTLEKRYWLWLALGVAGLDAVFKYLALDRLSETKENIIYPVDLLLHKNPGIAFDIELGLPTIFIASFLILGWLLHDANKTWHSERFRASTNLIIVIGAMGNLVDRAVNNFTTDYLLIFGSTVINLSDILVLFGVLLLLQYNRSTT
jgi:lipoprotein signal peptidase